MCVCARALKKMAAILANFACKLLYTPKVYAAAMFLVELLCKVC